MLDHAVRDGRLPRDPAASVRLPRLRRTQKRYLTDAEVAALRVRRVRLERRELGIAEGMKDVDGVASYSDTKTHRVRVIPFPAALVQDLAAAAAGKQPTDLVFTSPRGAPLRNGNSRRNVFDPAAARAGLAGLTPHELRHTAASLAVSAGANVKAVQRMLGDASAAMTLDVHADLFDHDYGDVAERLDETIRAQAPRSDADNARSGASPRHALERISAGQRRCPRPDSNRRHTV